MLGIEMRAKELGVLRVVPAGDGQVLLARTSMMPRKVATTYPAGRVDSLAPLS